ncbi:MAG: 30S ribosomal protein S6 [Planctomycetota bacterium]
MNRYELMLLLDTKEAKKDWEGLEAHIHDLIKKHGGEVAIAARWDERKLVYEIQGQKRAVYYLTYIQAPSEGIEPLRRDFQLSEKVLRYLFLKVDEFPEKVTTAQEIEEMRAAEDEIGGGSSRPPSSSPSSSGGGTATATKPETKTEAKPETKTEAKTETETEDKTEPDAKASESSESEDKSDGSSD